MFEMRPHDVNPEEQVVTKGKWENGNKIEDLKSTEDEIRDQKLKY